MIKVMDSDIINQTNCVAQTLKKSQVGTISGDAFQRKAFALLEEKIGRTYPYEVRIPKSIPEMLAGDFSPAKTIRIDKPIQGPYSDIWFGDATSGVKLLCGYINGDSRYVFDTELGDKVVHGIMVGATGQGKSVTLNSIIYNACALYAPWELHLTLSDAKIVEFKSIAQNNPMPHIEIVAATGDVDYLLSVLKTKVAEMEVMNSVFTEAQKQFGKPVKKLEDFRKVTGLTLPQNLLIFDEFQAMFSKAKKLSGEIVKQLDAFARLGRNTGYHLLLTSQELGTDIPKQMLANISFRGAMGCTPEVSAMILGNEQAALNLGKKGHMIVNLNSTAKNNEDSNVQIRVPFIDPQTSTIAHSCIEIGKQMDVGQKLQFYDEYAIEHESEFKEALSKLPYDPTKIYLGEPSFVTNGDLRRLTIDLQTDEVKNIAVVSPIQTDLMRHFLMLKLNNLRYKEITNIVLCANSIYATEYGARQLSDKLFFEDKDYENGQVFAIARSLIYRRILCIQADKLVFSPEGTQQDLTASDQIFYTIVEKDSELDTPINHLRFFFMKNLINTDAVIRSGFGDMNDEAKLAILRATLETYKTYDATDSCLTLDRVPDLNVWLLGLDKVLGIGIDSKSRNLQSLKKLLYDGNSANVRFTIFASTLDEIGDLNDMIHWYIFDNPVSRDLNKAKVQDDYPEQVGKSLAVMCDKKQPALGCLKFKKLFFDGEISAG